MNTRNFTGLLQKAVLVTMIGALAATDAMAWSFGSFGSFGGGWGSWGSCGSNGGYYRRHVNYYGSSGGYGSYGSNGGYGWSSDRVYYSRPVEYAPEAPPPPPADEETSAEATIDLTVPPEAEVYVNDRPTNSRGAQRHFVARRLRDGQPYAYRVRVEFQRNGEQVVENKLVPVKAGDAIKLDFGATQQLADENALETKLTLRVPHDAKVKLNGLATTQTGNLRNYVTSALAAGQTWDNYVVRVEAERNGQMLTDEKKLTLVGGKTHEVKFDLADEPSKLAALDGPALGDPRHP